MSAKHFQVPLYRHLATCVERFFDKDELGDIPLLNKIDIISGFPENFMTEAMRRGIAGGHVEFATTSGSSHQTLQIVRYKGWWNREFKYAYQRMDDMACYSIKHDKKAVLASAECSAASCFFDNPDYKKRILNGVLILNTHPDPTGWTAADIKRIDAELRTFAPALLEVDPIYLMIFLIKRAEYKIHEALYIPDYIVASYEFMPMTVRKLIESAYGRPVLSMFGSTELGVMFMQNRTGAFVRCDHNTVIELKPYLSHRNIFELIVTSWKNPLMPFLRYATGDLVEVEDGDWSGHTFKASEEIPLLRLHGRAKDAIITTDGDLKTLADLDEMLNVFSPWVRLYQLQITDISVKLFYVLQTSTDEVDMSTVYYYLIRWFGISRVVELINVPSIAPKLSGKFSFVKYII